MDFVEGALHGIVGAVSVVFWDAVFRRARQRREKRARPVNEFHGRIFPHPADDGWVDGSDRHGGIHLTNGPVLVTYGELKVDCTLIDKGPRQTAYRDAIRAAMERRKIDAALEKLP